MRRAVELLIRVFLAVPATAGMSLGFEKVWLPDLEWQTGSNWADGLLPDAKTIVEFPEETWHTVGLPDTGKLEVAEIYLPREGSLSLGSNGALTLNGSPAKGAERNARWVKKGLYLWIDPDNWKGTNRATPHVERIPCMYDTVVLPRKNRTLNMALPRVDVKVASVRIEGETRPLSQWEWSAIAHQPREFIKGRLTVGYAHPSQMKSVHSFVCHENNEISEEVCNFMWQGDKCGPPVCETPFQVVGHCCEFCGGRLGLSSKVSVAELQIRADKALENFIEAVSWYVRSTWDGYVEILVAEKGEYSGISSQEAIDVLTKMLKDDGYEILSSQVTGSRLTASQISNVLGPLLGIPLIIILLLLVVFPYYGYTYSQVYSAWQEAFATSGTPTESKTRSSFSFARFRNVPEGDVDLAESVVPKKTEIDDEDASSLSKRFENPLYRSQRDSEKSKQEKKSIDIDAAISLVDLETKDEEYEIEKISQQ